MKTFRKILLWILAIVAVLVIVAYLLPNHFKVERSATMKADRMVAYNLVSNLGKWDLWEPWNKEMDSTVTYELIGTDGQVGTVRKWIGKKLGDGQMTITELKPGEMVSLDLAFNQGKYKSTSMFMFEPVGDSVKVTWTVEGNAGYNPMSRYMGLFMDKFMGKDFAKGLAKMKTVAEERASWPRIEEKMVGAKVVLLVRDSAGPKTYSQVFGKGFGEMMAFIQRNKLKETGSPFAIYLKWDSVSQNSVFDMGIPVEKADKGMGRIRVEQVPPQNAVIAYYFGPYEKTGRVYTILHQYVTESGLTMNGGPWEIYVTDPMKEKDTMKWETDIMFPVK